MKALRTQPRRAITLVELLLLMVILWLALFGATQGGKIGAAHGRAGGVVGAFLGGIGGFAAVPVVLFAWEILWRLLQPSEYRCRCARPDEPGPQRLRPAVAVEKRAIDQTLRWSNWSELAPLQSSANLTRGALEQRLAGGMLTREQIDIAARLGHPLASDMHDAHARAISAPLESGREPMDLEAALRCGLPPRLCLVWAAACVARALPACEREFHQDTRPRQALGAAILVLRDEDSEAKEHWKRASDRIWWLREAGCRVARRGLWERLTDRRTAGENAAESAFSLLRAVFDYLEPSSLWASPPRGDIGRAYLTIKSRCEWSQPNLRASETAALARRAAADPAAELRWQQEALANLIVADVRWNHDREQWRVRVEECWIPRIRDQVKDPGFDVEEYIARVRQELVPWRAVSSTQ